MKVYVSAVHVSALILPILAALCLAQPASADTAPLTPCEKELSAADFSGILVGRPTLNRYSMNARLPGDGCEMGVSDTQNYGFVDIGVSKQSAGFYTNVTSYVKHTPMTGIGDEAAFLGTGPGDPPNTTATTVVARKGDLICTVEVDHSNTPKGEADIVKMSDDAMAQKLGALCAKVFAARP